jgi:hypothetical protein
MMLHMIQADRVVHPAPHWASRSGHIGVLQRMSIPGLTLLSRWLVAAFSAIVTVLATACQPAQPVQACPALPTVDGYVNVELEGRLGRMRVPPHASLVWSSDCKSVRSVEMSFQWIGDRLVAGKPIPGPDFFAFRVSVRPYGKPHPAVKVPEAWQFEPALPHRKYPIDFYPRLAWSAPDTPPTQTLGLGAWGVRGTSDQATGRPYLLSCDIAPLDPGRPESVVDGDFPPGSADAKCRGGVRVVKGATDLIASAHIPAKGVPHIDRIYRAISELITPLIQE